MYTTEGVVAPIQQRLLQQQLVAHKPQRSTAGYGKAYRQTCQEDAAPFSEWAAGGGGDTLLYQEYSAEACVLQRKLPSSMCNITASLPRPPLCSREYPSIEFLLTLTADSTIHISTH